MRLYKYWCIYTSRNSWPHQTAEWAAKHPRAWLFFIHCWAIKNTAWSYIMQGSYKVSSINFVLTVHVQFLKALHAHNKIRDVRTEVFLRPRLKTQLSKVFSKSLFLFHAAWTALNRGHVSTFLPGPLLFCLDYFLLLSWRYWMRRSVRLSHRGFSAVKCGDLDKPSAVCSGRPDTWANTAARWSVISYGNQHQPGRFCQRTKENASN